MENWLWPIDLSDLDPNLKGIEHLTKEEIQKIVAEKFEYFSSLIKYSRNAWLKMKPFKAAAWQEWTFACGLGDEWNKCFQKFMEWKIKFEDIPVKYFEPKYLYYRLPWLLTKENDVLWPIVDHELQHAESSDYGDIVRNSREAILHKLPVTVVWMFFNAFEDIYMWKKQIGKGRAKKMWVLNLYKDMYPTSWEYDVRWKELKLDQFSRLALSYRLQKEFPGEFNTKIIVDDDVQKEFDELIPHLDEITDINISNKERVKKKNEILRPIIDRLWQIDMENLKKSKMREQIKQERKQQQKQQLEDTKEKTKNDLKDNLWKEQWEWGQWWEWAEWGQWWEWAEWGEWWEWAEWGEWWEWAEWGQQWRWWYWWNQFWNWKWERMEWKEPIDSELEKEVERRLSGMSDKELEKFEEEMKKELDKRNIQEHKKELQVQKELLEQKDQSVLDKIKDIFGSKEERQQKKQEKQEEQEAQKSQEEMQKQRDEIVNAVEQRENDLNKEKEIQKTLDEISDLTKEKDLKTMKKLQEKLKELDELSENMDTKDIKEKIQERVKSLKEYIKQQDQKYEKQMKKCWFSVEEESLYKKYIKIEKEMSKYLDRFIKELEREIPKLKEYSLQWWYTSWRVTDMNDAGKKIRLWQWGEKLYSRYEETESMEINLWICLSIDMSGSMDGNIYDTIKLVVFLWLLCEKRWIPFHVNTFSEWLTIIKDTDDDFGSKKWRLMKEMIPYWCTNVSVAVQKDLEVIKGVKKTHPDTVFLPIFITDGEANKWITGQWLIELMKWFKWLSIMAGIWIYESYLRELYPDSKVVSLDSSSEIMTKLLRSLKQFFKQHKSKIFKVTTE